MADPESLRIGDIIEVNVLDVPSYGVELEYEGKPGFMQIPELSWDPWNRGGAGVSVQVHSLTRR